MLTNHDFYGFWSPKWSQKSRISRGFLRPGSDFAQRSLQDGFQTSFVMLWDSFLVLLESMFKVLGFNLAPLI